MAAAILVVEDNPKAVALIRGALDDAGHDLVATDSAAEALRLFERTRFDLAIIDIILREGSGLDVCRRIRAHPERGATPLILLTGETALETKTQGFEAGADTYLTKPLEVAELTLWVEALLRRARGERPGSSAIRIGPIAVDPETHIVRCGEAAVPGLTAKEFKILLELARASPGTLSRDELIARVWGKGPVPTTLDFHLSRLRSKLGAVGAAHLVSVREVGYRLE